MQVPGHKITWWVWAGGEKIRRTSSMRGFWGYDASCSCGWKTKTGGAVRRYVQDEVDFHKSEVSTGSAVR
jgi:hypothetical protein